MTERIRDRRRLTVRVAHVRGREVLGIGTAEVSTRADLRGHKPVEVVAVARLVAERACGTGEVPVPVVVVRPGVSEWVRALDQVAVAVVVERGRLILGRGQRARDRGRVAVGVVVVRGLEPGGQGLRQHVAVSVVRPRRLAIQRVGGACAVPRAVVLVVPLVASPVGHGDRVAVVVVVDELRRLVGGALRGHDRDGHVVLERDLADVALGVGHGRLGAVVVPGRVVPATIGLRDHAILTVVRVAHVVPARIFDLRKAMLSVVGVRPGSAPNIRHGGQIAVGVAVVHLAPAGRGRGRDGTVGVVVERDRPAAGRRHVGHVAVDVVVDGRGVVVAIVQRQQPSVLVEPKPAAVGQRVVEGSVRVADERRLHSRRGDVSAGPVGPEGCGAAVALVDRRASVAIERQPLGERR